MLLGLALLQEPRGMRALVCEYSMYLDQRIESPSRTRRWADAKAPALIPGKG